MENEPIEYAFPIIGHQTGPDTTGMTLRDYFAAHAPEVPKWFQDNFFAFEKQRAMNDDSYIQRGNIEAICEWRFKYADSMLKARKDGQ